MLSFVSLNLATMTARATDMEFVLYALCCLADYLNHFPISPFSCPIINKFPNSDHKHGHLPLYIPPSCVPSSYDTLIIVRACIHWRPHSLACSDSHRPFIPPCSGSRSCNSTLPKARNAIHSDLLQIHILSPQSSPIHTLVLTGA